MPSQRLRPLDPRRLAQHTDALYRAAWALCGSTHDAEDLVQDTFVNVLARPRLIRGSELGYLLRALRNAHADRYRAAARRPVTVELLDQHAAATRESEASARAVLQAIAAAPPRFRYAVIAIDLGANQTAPPSVPRTIRHYTHRGVTRCMLLHPRGRGRHDDPDRCLNTRLTRRGP